MNSSKRNFNDLSIRQKRRIIDQDILKLCTNTNEFPSYANPNKKRLSQSLCDNSACNNECSGSEQQIDDLNIECHPRCHLNNHESSPFNVNDNESEISGEFSNLIGESSFCNLRENLDDEISSGMGVEVNSSNSLSNDLAKWFMLYNIPHRAASSLLKLLKNNGHNELPSDVRTLLSTPKNTHSQIIEEGGGTSAYFGLANGLVRSIERYYKSAPKSIKIDINVDGLPIAKSSCSQFWPILCSLVSSDFISEPFIIKIFHGLKKQENVNSFLQSFIEEATVILEDGIIFKNKPVQVIMNAIICDAPARAFICGIKHHSGYFGCGKCIQEGNFLENRVVFPEVNATLRTDQSFKNRSQPEHHISSSDMEKLNIGMVSQVPLDYMHLICLGVMKRLLIFWVRGRMDVRIKKTLLPLVIDRCSSVKRTVTKEFSRSARSVLEVDRWKATEFRQFILYSGIFILRDMLPRPFYEHFLSISIAIRILADEEYHIIMFDYASELLNYFVKKYGSLYGNEYLSYNVHNVIHLCDDVRMFGPLDRFSAFKYENFMYKLKSKLKSSSRPLHQIVNRITEQNKLPVQLENQNFPIIHYKNEDVDFIQFKKFCITRKEFNNCCLVDNNIVVVENIFIKNKILYIQGRKYITSLPFFEVPCDSTVFNIVVVSQVDLSETLSEYMAMDIKRKYFVIDITGGSFLLVPLIL